MSVIICEECGKNLRGIGGSKHYRRKLCRQCKEKIGNRLDRKIKEKFRLDIPVSKEEYLEWKNFKAPRNVRYIIQKNNVYKLKSVTSKQIESRIHIPLEIPYISELSSTNSSYINVKAKELSDLYIKLRMKVNKFNIDLLKTKRIEIKSFEHLYNV